MASLRLRRAPAVSRSLVLAVACVISLACRTPLPAYDAPGASDAYRAELAKGDKGDRSKAARQGLEKAEFEAAKREHTVLAYRHYLSEFPAGPFSEEVRARLEALRWIEADNAGTESALRGFLVDEPRGSHAAEAWRKLAALELQAALASGNEERLRNWLTAFPGEVGRDRALAALDEVQFAAAKAGGADDAAGALRRYLAERPDGRHRAEAQALLTSREVDEAALLEDDGRLSELARQGAQQEVGQAAERLELRRAAARLDRETIARLAQGGGPAAAEAAALLAQLGDSAELTEAARALYLPAATDDELPDDAAERAAQLRAWALALDGRRLGAVLSEVRSSRSYLALEALAAGGELLAGLPPAEARVRAAALADALRPRAQSSALLVQLSVLDEAAGRVAQALGEARAASGREPSLAGDMRAAQLEARAGQPALTVLAARTLSAQAELMGELHFDAARGTGERPPDPAGLLELCAAFRGAREAERLLGDGRVAAEPGAREALEQARRVAGRVGGRLDEAERAAAGRRWMTCAHREELATEAARAAVARRVAAARKLVDAPAAQAALARARARDPSVEVQQALSRGPGGSAPAHAEAAPAR